MILIASPTAISNSQFSLRLHEPTNSNFWSRILADEELDAAENLEKILAGCEIIAALDSVDLLAA